VFTLGLAAAGLPISAFAESDPAPAASASPPEPIPDSVLAASVDLNDRLTVPVTVNGRGPFPFVVDTGSNRTVVSDTLATQLGMPASGTMQIKAATGVAQTGSVRVKSLEVGHRRLTDFQAPVLQVDNLGALGMIGIDAVADQRLVMDFRKKQMAITKSVRVEPEPGALVVLAKSKYGQLLLVDSEVEGIPLYVIIDTGSEVTVGNMAMRSFLARRRRGGVDLVDVAGDKATVDIGQLPELHVGKVIVLNEQVAYADLYVFEHLGLHGKPSMLLGMSTLRKCAKVSIDFPAREVRFVLA
jgi:predicted aspartyl protease